MPITRDRLGRFAPGSHAGAEKAYESTWKKLKGKKKSSLKQSTLDKLVITTMRRANTKNQNDPEMAAASLKTRKAIIEKYRHKK
jgi:hypothetical protein